MLEFKSACIKEQEIPITAALRLRPRRQRCSDLPSFFLPDVSLVQWPARLEVGGSNDPPRGAGLDMKKISVGLTCDCSLRSLLLRFGFPSWQVQVAMILSERVPTKGY